MFAEKGVVKQKGSKPLAFIFFLLRIVPSHIPTTLVATPPHTTPHFSNHPWASRGCRRSCVPLHEKSIPLVNPRQCSSVNNKTRATRRVCTRDQVSERRGHGEGLVPWLVKRAGLRGRRGHVKVRQRTTGILLAGIAPNMRRLVWGTRFVGRIVWQSAAEACILGIRICGRNSRKGALESLQLLVWGEKEERRMSSEHEGAST